MLFLCNAVDTVKHILIEFADLLEIKKIFFRRKIFVFTFSKRNCGFLFVLAFLREIGVFYKI